MKKQRLFLQGSIYGRESVYMKGLGIRWAAKAAQSDVITSYASLLPLAIIWRVYSLSAVWTVESRHNRTVRRDKRDFSSS